MIPVIYAIPRSEVGGAQRSLLLLLRGLDRAAFPPYVLLGEDGPLARSLEALDVPYSIGPSFRSLKGISLFAKVARQHGARVLHLFGARTLALAARGLGLAVIERVNLMRSAEAGGLVASPFLDRALLRLAHLVIVPSEAMRAQLEERGIPARKVRLVPNGVFLEEPRVGRAKLRASLSIPEDAFLLLCLGRLVPVKGQDLLLEAVASLKDPGIVLLLAGEGPERGPLEARAQRLGITSSVRFLGDRADVAELLQASDLLVQASRSEVLANAVLEGMLSGIAIVATDVGGTREVVRSNETGLLVAPGSAPALAQAIAALKCEPGRRFALGNAGRALVARDRSVAAMARATEAVYREAVEAIT
jgi:glycosyltransferase involved in cell wall biosynthesis